MLTKSCCFRGGVEVSRLKTPFALRNDKIVCIADIEHSENGLRCGCICPLCKTHLIARMGDINQHHFAHTGNACDEEKAYKLSLYTLIKELIDERKEIALPEIVIGYDYTLFELTRENICQHINILKCKDKSKHYQFYKQATKQTIIAVDKVDVCYEKSEQIGALEVYSKGKCFAIKVALPTTICKVYQFTQHKDMSTLLIDFRDKNLYLELIDRKMMQQLIIDELSKKTWIHNTKIEASLAEIICENNLRIRNNEIEYNKMYKVRDQSAENSNQSIIKTLIPNYLIPNDENSNLSQSEKNKLGYEQVVANFDIESTEPIRDSFDKHWLYCTECKNLKMDDQMRIYGGENSMNKGICRECHRKSQLELVKND
jgi:hypothetical protein